MSSRMGMALRKAPAPSWLTATKRTASRQASCRSRSLPLAPCALPFLPRGADRDPSEPRSLGALLGGLHGEVAPVPVVDHRPEAPLRLVQELVLLDVNSARGSSSLAGTRVCGRKRESATLVGLGWPARRERVGCGREHNLAITADGSVWSWGYGVDGRLAHGDDQAPVAAEEDRGLCWSARRRRVGWRGSQPRRHRRRRRLELGLWRGCMSNDAKIKAICPAGGVDGIPAAAIRSSATLPLHDSHNSW